MSSSPSQPIVTESSTLQTESGQSHQSIPNVPPQEDVESLVVTNITGPYMKLWHILRGTVDIVSNEIIHEELTRRCNNIITGLMLYDSPTPFQIPELTPKSTSEDKVRVGIIKALKIEFRVADELLKLYLIYEYKGKVENISSLLPDEKSIEIFVEEIIRFYKKERICLLYCAQVILHGATDSNHLYSAIFSGFIAGASMHDWCHWLCLSLERAEDEIEAAQVLHTLSLLIAHYSHFEGVVDEFIKSFKFCKGYEKSEMILLAETTPLLSFLHLTDAATDSDIEKFLEKNNTSLCSNEFLLGPIIAAYSARASGNQVIKRAIHYAPHPSTCVKRLTYLLKEYERKSFRNKHGIDELVARGVYYVAEFILNYHDKETFGTDSDWYSLLDALLHDKKTCHKFLCERPTELFLLYTEILTLFPVEIKWTLSIWSSFCHSANSQMTALSILNRCSEINAVAEEFIVVSAHDIRPNGNEEWMSVGERNIGGVVIEAESIGSTVREDPLVVSWDLEAPSQSVSVWELLQHVVIDKALAQHPSYSLNSIQQITYLSQFLSRFSEASRELPPKMLNLYYSTSILLKNLFLNASDPSTKSKYVVLLLDLLKGVSVYNPEFLTTKEMMILWPTRGETSVICDIILTHESVLNTDYSVTKAFLNTMIELFEKSEDDPYELRLSLNSSLIPLDSPNFLFYTLKTLYINSLSFISENIYPSFGRWRIEKLSDQLEIIRDTFRLFYNLFSTTNNIFSPLKNKCVWDILAPGNSILHVLNIDEEKLQDSWIRTSKDNQYLDQTMFYALVLLDKLAMFDIKTLKILDDSSNLTLVKKLGKLVHHLLNPSIPTLAINLLSRIAEELDISLLSCFGDGPEGIDSFRDKLYQLLVYKSRATKIKVATLKFLTICAQTQLGLIQYFFKDDSFTQTLIELLDEEDQILPLKSLCVFRALFRKGNLIFKNQRSDIWDHIIGPYNRIKFFDTLESRKTLVTYTLHIISFEAFRCTAIESEFSSVLEKILSKESLKLTLDIVLDWSEGEEMRKCLVAFKVFLTLIRSRTEFDMMLPVYLGEESLKKISTAFWSLVEEDESGEITTSLAEMLRILGPSKDSLFLDDFAQHMSAHFENCPLSVQLPLLIFVHKSICCLRTELSTVTLDSLVRALSKIFLSSNKIFETEDMSIGRQLLVVASAMIHTIISSPHCNNWVGIFRRRLVINSIISVAHTGLSKGQGHEIVLDCLGSLLRLCRIPETSRILTYSKLSIQLYLPLVAYSTPDVYDEKWSEIFMLCCELNAEMLRVEKYDYLEESLNFWSVHKQFLTVKLFGLTDLINHSYLQSPDHNFQNLMQLLSFIAVIFHSLSAMAPYFQKWRLEQLHTLLDLMNGVLSTLQTSVSLLSNANHLLLIITKPTKTHSVSPGFKLTPQLLEIQTKLWEVVSLGTHIYLKVGSMENELINKEQILPVLFSLIGLCTRALSKHSDRKQHPAVNITTDLTMSLEKSLFIVASYFSRMTQGFEFYSNEEKGFAREASSEIASLTDMVKRVGLPSGDFSLRMCNILEGKVKDMLCK